MNKDKTVSLNMVFHHECDNSEIDSHFGHYSFTYLKFNYDKSALFWMAVLTTQTFFIVWGTAGYSYKSHDRKTIRIGLSFAMWFNKLILCLSDNLRYGINH